MEHHYRLSSFREKTLEHVFVGECLKALWKRGVYDAEVLRSEVDAAGYDIVLECHGIVRHVQLKSSYIGAKTARQSLNNKLKEKPSGCAIWLQFDPRTLALGPFYWYGNSPGEKIDDLSKTFKKAKHTKGNSKGVKLERDSAYSVPKRAFRRLPTIDDVLTELFGETLATSSTPRTSSPRPAR
jgi:hypothetical protein